MSVPVETVKAFAPIIHFHKDEQYLPCSIEYLLRDGVLKDRSPTPIWGQKTSIPAIAAFRGRLWMVYSDANSSRLWVTSSDDGIEWDDAAQISGQRTSVPALAAFGDRLWMAYTSADSSEILVTSSEDGLQWSAAASIGQ